MKIVVGLGNPDKKYKQTRHNAGFLMIDDFFGHIMSDPKTPGSFTVKASNNFHGLTIPLHPVFDAQLFKPQTFMNESGKAVKAICDFYKIDIKKDLLIVHDDSDLLLGTIRTTNSSSSAGHNGVANIIEKLGTQEFHRIRVGVESRGSKNDIPTDIFVLQNFTGDELKKLHDDVFPKVKTEIEKFLKIGN